MARKAKYMKRMGKRMNKLAVLALLFPFIALAQTSTLTWTTTYQTIDGWGGATIGSNNQSNITGAHSSFFFSASSGIGLTYFRTGNTSDGSIPDLASMQAAVSNGALIFLTLSSPPASIKQSGSF